ncbi:hypothetical protein H696_01566 [Fonticula alba]|uniref:Exportin-7/Ran-binding protein 17 TPR repeats domain-containing protein n=1 Tax=Fonticula alba TaxID=691883 RepID=A0A058ZCQ5_FONAL|nr:hypothetical protein H696_01566 [Fonticula alba]KCV72164.1 hypothetical protein H696_01566 [Fonticula alba]|eukprot:XP_009493742.1 hypothetical protein H696_01566 [Fonticula alba]
MNIEGLHALENLTAQLYSSHSKDARDSAEAMLRPFSTEIDRLGDCKMIIEQSRSPYALKFALSSCTNPPLIHLGLILLQCLVTEIDQASGIWVHSSQHRKLASIFRDNQLLHIFEHSLKLLMSFLKMKPDELGMDGPRVIESLFVLIRSCLSFDFVGASSQEEGSEDAATIQVPDSWRAALKSPPDEPGPAEALFKSVTYFGQDLAALPMECLVLVCSFRRSFFPAAADRLNFLNKLVTGSNNLLKDGSFLSKEDAYHEFCRFLSRLKFYYQLSEVTATTDYFDWINSVYNFTLQALQSWHWSPNSLQYILSFWDRIFQWAFLHLDMAISQQISNFAASICRTYIKTRLASVTISSGGPGPGDANGPGTGATGSPGDDNPLDEEELLLGELDLLSSALRCHYETTALEITKMIDQLTMNYQSMLAMGQTADRAVTEAHLAWLVYIAGRCIAGRSIFKPTDEHDRLDGSLVCSVLRLSGVHDNWISSPAAPPPERLSLQFAIHAFVLQFKKTYLSPQTSHTAPAPVFGPLAQHFAIANIDGALDYIVNMLVRWLLIWPNQPQVIARTVTELNTLTLSYSLVRVFSRLPVASKLLQNFSPKEFPFMQHQANWKMRVCFVQSLTRLLLAAGDSEDAFDAFVSSLDERLRQLIHASASGSLVGMEIEAELIFRDLRGIVTACQTKRHYQIFFNWFFESYFSIIPACLAAFSPRSSVSVAGLKFVADLAHNKSQRLVFETSSADGIRLFRGVAAAVTAFGERLLNSLPPGASGFKAMLACFNALYRALSGLYVCFGVFALYGDASLKNALSMFVRLCLSVPLRDMMNLPKLTIAYCELTQHVLSTDHLLAMPDIPLQAFVYMLASFSVGSKSLGSKPSTLSCANLDSISRFIWDELYSPLVIRRRVKQLAAQKQLPASSPSTMLSLRSQLAMPVAGADLTSLPPDPTLHPFIRFSTERPELLQYIIVQLLQTLIFQDSHIFWSLSRPLLPLVLLYEKFFSDLTQELIEYQTPALQPTLKEAFDCLMNGVERSLSVKNRDRFVHNILLFRRLISASSSQLVPSERFQAILNNPPWAELLG